MTVARTAKVSTRAKVRKNERIRLPSLVRRRSSPAVGRGVPIATGRHYRTKPG
jgi:hypothetical protein